MDKIREQIEKLRAYSGHLGWYTTSELSGSTLEKDQMRLYADAANTMVKLLAVLDAAQVPRHDYCGTDDWFIELDKAVYLATADFGERYRDKYADPDNATREHNEP